MHEMIYEAVALSERFPELPDHEVIEHINFVFKTNVRDYTLLGHAILIAYGTQNEHRGLDFLSRMNGLGVS